MCKVRGAGQIKVKGACSNRHSYMNKISNIVLCVVSLVACLSEAQWSISINESTFENQDKWARVEYLIPGFVGSRGVALRMDNGSLRLNSVPTETYGEALRIKIPKSLILKDFPNASAKRTLELHCGTLRLGSNENISVDIPVNPFARRVSVVAGGHVNSTFTQSFINDVRVKEGFDFLFSEVVGVPRYFTAARDSAVRDIEMLNAFVERQWREKAAEVNESGTLTLSLKGAARIACDLMTNSLEFDAFWKVERSPAYLVWNHFLTPPEINRLVDQFESMRVRDSRQGEEGLIAAFFNLGVATSAIGVNPLGLSRTGRILKLAKSFLEWDWTTFGVKYRRLHEMPDRGLDFVRKTIRELDQEKTFAELKTRVVLPQNIEVEFSE
jgi:hypothetical protein